MSSSGTAAGRHAPSRGCARPRPQGTAISSLPATWSSRAGARVVGAGPITGTGAEHPRSSPGRAGFGGFLPLQAFAIALRAGRPGGRAGWTPEAGMRIPVSRCPKGCDVELLLHLTAGLARREGSDLAPERDEFPMSLSSALPCYFWKQGVALVLSGCPVFLQCRQGLEA